MTYKGSFQLFLQPIEYRTKTSKLNISLPFKCRKLVKLVFLILKVGVQPKKEKRVTVLSVKYLKMVPSMF